MLNDNIFSVETKEILINQGAEAVIFIYIITIYLI